VSSATFGAAFESGLTTTDDINCATTVKKHQASSPYLAYWPLLNNREAFSEQIETDPFYSGIENWMISQAATYYKQRAHDENKDAPRSHKLTANVTVNVFNEDGRLFIDSELPFAGGGSKQIFHSLMLSFDDHHQIWDASLVAKSVITEIDEKRRSEII